MFQRSAAQVHRQLCSIRHFSSKTSKFTIPQFMDLLKSAQQHRAYLVWDDKSKKLKTSHPCLDDLAASIESNKRDFHNHEGVFFSIGAETQTLQVASLHCTTRGPGAGGVRFWPYHTINDMVVDGLRLSEGMGRKNALAGLWWGGGKGNVARPEGELYKDKRFRETLFQEYGQFMTSLRGCYVTAEDAGVNTEDMAHIFKRTRFTTCIPAELGGSGNPSAPTALGVICGMEGALAFLGMGDLQGKRVAVQGLGNVASAMVQTLWERGVAAVIATDINPDAIARAEAQFARRRGREGQTFQAKLVQPGDNSVLFTPNVDIVSPCALGGILNEQTIPQIQAKIVCGAANNQQLDDQVDDKRLTQRGITYVPDFLANRMGITNCANEETGYVNNDPAIQRHLGRDWDNSVFNMTQRVLALARDKNITTTQAANQIADELMKQDHPIWPNRSRQIIQSLVENQWHRDHWPAASKKN